MSLVKKDSGEVISPCHDSHIKTKDTLAFKVVEITDSSKAVDLVAPKALQVLFTAAARETGDDPPPPFSPFLGAGGQVPVLATTELTALRNATSIAYGDSVDNAWSVTWNGAPSLMLDQEGRFELRALLTIARPGELARFYRVDPEMVVGPDGTGPGPRG